MDESQQWRGLPPDIDALEAACLRGELAAVQRCAAWVDDPHPYTRARAAQALATTSPALWASLLACDPGTTNPTPGWWYVLELVATDSPATWPAHGGGAGASHVLPQALAVVAALVDAAPVAPAAAEARWMAAAHHALAVLPPGQHPTVERLLGKIWECGDDALVVEGASWQLANQPQRQARPEWLARLAQVRGAPAMAALLARVRWQDAAAVAPAIARAMREDPLSFQLFAAVEESSSAAVRAEAAAVLAPLVTRRFFVSAMTVRAAAAGVVLGVAGALEALVRYASARRPSTRALARSEWVRVAADADLPALLSQIVAANGDGWEDAMEALVLRSQPACEAALATLAAVGSREVREAIAEARNARGR